jgi:signal peptidase I
VAEKKREVEELLDSEQKRPEGESAVAWAWDLLKTWGPALLAVLIIRSVVAEPFRIPSGSMVPTLEIGDYIIVNKFAYGLRFPFTTHRLLPVGDPDAGDIIVFKWPGDLSVDYIKRVVAVPGDEVLVRHNQLYVNGTRVEKEFVEDYSFVDDNCTAAPAELYNETFDGERHTILYSPGTGGRLSEFGPFTVPEGEVFVMGDNRDNSSDSRAWGTVPRINIKGKALVVWLSWDHCDGKLGTLRLRRFGTVLK